MRPCFPTLAALLSGALTLGCFREAREDTSTDLGAIPGRTSWMSLNCASPEGARATPCAIRLVWWELAHSLRSRDPYWKDNISAGLGVLAAQCTDHAQDDWNAGRDPRACLYLGDAYAAGRGVDRSAMQAAYYYGLGCAVSAGESACPGPRGQEPYRTGRPELDQWVAPRSACNVNCRRLEDPRSVSDDPLEDERIDIRAYGPIPWLGDGDSALADGAAVAASAPTGAFLWMRGLLAVGDLPRVRAALTPPFMTLVDARWAAEVVPLEATSDWEAALPAARAILGSSSSVQPLMDLFSALRQKAALKITAAAETSRHYLPAITRLERLMGPALLDDARLAPLEALRRSAADYHRAAATRAGPMLAALHHELAQRALGIGVGPLATLRAQLVDGILAIGVIGPTCPWLVAPLAAAFPASAHAVPAELAVSCTHDEAFATRSGSITQYRTVPGYAGGTAAGRWESYPCKRVEGGHMTREGWVFTGSVSATCQRWVEGEAIAATSERQVEVEERFHVATRTRRASVSGTLRIGERLPVPIAVTEEDVEVAPVLEQKFSDRTVAFVQDKAAAELVAAVQSQALVLLEARALAADRLARSTRGSGREEAYVLALLHGVRSPPALAWLQSEFGVSPEALDMPPRFPGSNLGPASK